jgi:hypothetical protein
MSAQRPVLLVLFGRKQGASREFPLQCDVVQSGQGLGTSGKPRSTYILDFGIWWSSPVSLIRSIHFITAGSIRPPPPVQQARRPPKVLLSSRELNHGSSAVYPSHYQNYVPLEWRHDCWRAGRQGSVWAYSYKSSPEKLNEPYGHLYSENRLLCSVQIGQYTIFHQFNCIYFNLKTLIHDRSDMKRRRRRRKNIT